MRDRFIYTVFGGFVLGIFLRSFFDFGIYFPIFLAGLGFTVALLPRFFPDSVGTSRRGLVFVCLTLFAVALGVLRFDISDISKNETTLAKHVGEMVTLRAVVTDEPDERENSLRLTVDVGELEVSGRIASAEGRTLVVADLYPAFAYGDRVELVGKLARPKNFHTEDGRDFDYRSYLAKEGIGFEMFHPKIKRLESGQGNKLVAVLFSVKHAFVKSINRSIPAPHSALLAGLTIGAKQSLGKDLLDDFRRAGVIHIVVLSGYNITIIAYFIEWLFSRFKKNLRLILAGIAIVLFAVMTGVSATIVRATIMAILVITAKATGRIYQVTRALLLAGFLMLLHNPQILVFDTSFQLSFLATLGLIYVSPIIEPMLHFVTTRWKLREIVTATLATQLFVLPVLLYKMGELSLVALPVNLLILVVIPATMLAGFITGVIGMIHLTLAAPFAFVAYGLLAYELGIVEWFSHLPFASVAVPYFPAVLAIVVYIIYGLVLLCLKEKKGKGVYVPARHLTDQLKVLD